MYLARFASQNMHLVSAAFRWPRPEGALLSREWTRDLLAQTTFDVALRVEVGSNSGNILLLLSTGDANEGELQNFAQQLLKSKTPSCVAVPSDAQEFDDFTGGLPSKQIRVNLQGYHHGGNPLACDFRLYATLESYSGTAPAIYQVHLRPHLPSSEIERRARKYIAWLDIEQPFSTPVRAMQRMLSLRLLQPGFVAGEYLATLSSEDLEQQQIRIRTQFKETTGRLGFPDPPIEVGNFSDIMVIGCHPARFEGLEPGIPVLGAAVFGEEETAMLISRSGAFGLKAAASHRGESRSPDVFISYASSDYAYAAATCRSLEEDDIICWIAPRNINCGILPYPEAILHGLSQVRAVVVVLSEAANLSVHIPRELDLALERKLMIIPVRLKDVVPAGQLKFLLSTCQWLDTYGRDFDTAMKELIMRLRMLLG